MTEQDRKVAVITGGSQGIGAGLVAGYYAGLGSQLPPLGHVGQVRDIVDGILFLESSPFITGEILHIDGGQIAGH